MSPTPDWNPKLIKPIQDAWPKIEPVQKTYMNVLSGLTSIFGFASAIALIASHKFQPPKWPFTSEHWNPKPTAQKKQEEREKEITDKELREDELAAAAGGIVKRSIAFERDSRDDDAFYHSFAKRDEELGKELIEDAEVLKNATTKVGEKAKEAFGDLGKETKDNAESIWESVEKEAEEIVDVAKEIAEEIWDDVKRIFGHDDSSKPTSAGAANNRTEGANSTSTRTKRRRMAVDFVY